MEAPDVPNGWKETTLGEVAHIQRGASPRPITDPRWFDPSSGVGRVRISDVTHTGAGRLDETADYLSKAGIEHSRFLPEGSLIMSICATIGVPTVTGFDTCIHDGFVGITELRGIDQQFLLHLLRQLEPHFRSLGQTGSQANLNSDLVRSCQVLIPESMLDQARIAAVLDDMDTSITALRALIDKKRAVQQAVTQDLLSCRVRLSDFSAPWEHHLLNSISSFMKTKALSRAELGTSGNVDYVHYGDIHTRWNDYLDLDRENLPTAELSQAGSATLVQDGDLIIADASEDLSGVGKGVEVENVGARSVIAGLHTVLLRPMEGYFSPGFIGVLQHMPEYKAQARALAAGLKVYGLSKTALGKFDVALPRPEEQAAIAALLKDLAADIDALEVRRAKMSTVKQAASRVLLTGRIRLS